MRRHPVLCAGLCLASALVIGFPSLLCAAEPKVPVPIGADFENQGEYTGSVSLQMGSSEVGVQLVARGDDKFTAVGYPGGLPGDGWDHSQRYADKSGMLAGGVIEFKGGQGFSSTAKGGVMTIFLGGVELSKLNLQPRVSPALGAPPPEGAIVLFDGSSAEKFEGGKMDEDDLLIPGCTSKDKLGSGKLHLEFRVPFMPKAEGLARGNSGVYLQGRYEIQILDSFGLDETDKECGAIFGIKPPDQNMSYPPYSWQTYDIDFAEPKYENGAKVEGSEATVTVKHNGIAIHRRAKIAQATAGSQLAAGPGPGPLHLQDHGDPVRFQNIWFLPKKAE